MKNYKFSKEIKGLFSPQREKILIAMRKSSHHNENFFSSR